MGSLERLANVRVMCPVCGVPIAEDAVNWSEHRAVCGKCAAQFVLEGELFPRPFENYLERLTARRAPAPAVTPMRIQEHKGTITVRRAGLLGLIAKRIMLSSDGIEVRTRFGKSARVALVEVRGFAAVQYIVPYVTNHPQAPGDVWVGWYSKVLLDTHFPTVFPHPSYEEAAYVASALNEGLQRLRVTTPYR